MKFLVASLFASWLIALPAFAQTPAEREAIERVFDRNKGALYALYGRALRDNPGLKGGVEIEISIAASGETTNCRIVASELHAPDLENKFCARVSQMRFAPLAAPVKVNKRVDFFPAA